MLVLAPPGEGAISDQILDIERAVITDPELPERDFDPGFLRVIRIEIDRDEDHLVTLARGLAVIEDMLVRGIVEAHVEMRVQGRIGLAECG